MEDTSSFPASFPPNASLCTASVSSRSGCVDERLGHHSDRGASSDGRHGRSSSEVSRLGVMNGLSGRQVTSHMSCDQRDGLLVWCERGGASCLVWISTRWLLMKSSGQDGGAALACCQFGDSRAKYEAKLMFYLLFNPTEGFPSCFA